MDYLRRLTTFLTDLLWPARCAACGQGDVFACAACLAHIQLPPAQRCPACQHRSGTGVPCSGCRIRTHLDRLIAAAPLDTQTESFVYALKYRSIQSLAVPLADRICSLLSLCRDTAAVFGSNPLIIPVPLHPTRLRERGYNQAELLAHRISDNTAMALDTASLIRIRHTGQQAKAGGRIQRRENMSDAFSVPDNVHIKDRDIILVDDICTTGATLEDCARALKEAGANSVTALTLAHG